MDPEPASNANEALLELAPAGLAGKTASEPDIVRWVARNIDNPAATAEDAPDPFAWTLLRQCRTDAGFQLFFVEKLWSKLIPSRAQLGDQDSGGEIDGQPTIELIARIRAIGQGNDRGEGVGIPAGAHSSGDAGSIPAPATIPDEFEEFEDEE